MKTWTLSVPLALLALVVTACGTEDEDAPADGGDPGVSLPGDTGADVAVPDWIGDLDCETVHQQVEDWATANASCTTDDECAIWYYERDTECGCRDYLGRDSGLAVNAGVIGELSFAAAFYATCPIRSAVCDGSQFESVACIDGTCVGSFPPIDCMIDAGTPDTNGIPDAG